MDINIIMDIYIFYVIFRRFTVYQYLRKDIIRIGIYDFRISWVSLFVK